MSLLRPGVRVAWIGDSHTEALGPRAASALPAQLGVQFVRSPEARRGWSVRRYVQAGDVPSLTSGADVVVVVLGGNDAAAGISAAAHAQDVTALLRQIGDRPVVWVGPGVTRRPDLETARQSIRAAQRDLIPRLGHMWIDGQPLTRLEELAPDGVHFTAAGYTSWMSRLIPALAQVRIGAQRAASWAAPAAVLVAGAAVFAAWAWSRSRGA